MMKKFMLVVSSLVVMSLALVGCGSKAPAYVDGTYEGVGAGLNGEISVEVVVTEGKISAVNVLEHEETEGISDEALVEVPKTIVEKNSTEVDGVAGATYTSDGIKEAVTNALEGKTE